MLDYRLIKLVEEEVYYLGNKFLVEYIDEK